MCTPLTGQNPTFFKRQQRFYCTSLLHFLCVSLFKLLSTSFSRPSSLGEISSGSLQWAFIGYSLRWSLEAAAQVGWNCIHNVYCTPWEFLVNYALFYFKSILISKLYLSKWIISFPLLTEKVYSNNFCLWILSKYQILSWINFQRVDTRIAKNMNSKFEAYFKG